MSYPEHKKLQAIQDKSQAIGNFLEWLHTKNCIVCQKVPHVLSESSETFLRAQAKRKGIKYEAPFDWLPANLPIEKTLAEYFHIDLERLEQEKRAMLEELRRANAQPLEA